MSYKVVENKYFTKEDIEDLSYAFEVVKGKKGVQGIAETFNEELYMLSDKEIKKELEKIGIEVPKNLKIERENESIEFNLD